MFRQESYFHWTFGVQEPDYMGAIDILTGRSFLFAPHIPESALIWVGPILSNSEVQEKYGVDEVYYASKVKKGF